MPYSKNVLSKKQLNTCVYFSKILYCWQICYQHILQLRRAWCCTFVFWAIKFLTFCCVSNFLLRQTCTSHITCRWPCDLDLGLYRWLKNLVMTGKVDGRWARGRLKYLDIAWVHVGKTTWVQLAQLTRVSDDIELDDNTTASEEEAVKHPHRTLLERLLARRYLRSTPEPADC